MNDFERVKQSLDLLQVITHETSLCLKGEYLEQCPFCTEPSCFTVNQTNNTYTCSSCGRSGNVRTFISEYFSLPDDWLDEKLAEVAGELATPDFDHVPEDEARESAKETIFRLARDHYRQNIGPEDSPGRRWFCAVRGHAPLTLVKMQVGYSTGRLLPFLQEHDFSAAVAAKKAWAKTS